MTAGGFVLVSSYQFRVHAPYAALPDLCILDNDPFGIISAFTRAANRELSANLKLRQLLTAFY